MIRRSRARRPLVTALPCEALHLQGSEHPQRTEANSLRLTNWGQQPEEKLSDNAVDEDGSPCSMAVFVFVYMRRLR